jgi:glycosyltransferase involved in cell wall biosynthesis
VGHLPELDDVHKMASCAKICVLPTYHDTIPGTIIESMFLKLPVVSYSTGGIPVVNANEECLALVDAGDVNGLAEKILWLLLNPDIREEYGKRAFYRAIEMFDNSLIAGDIISAYNKVIEEFKKK